MTKKLIVGSPEAMKHEPSLEPPQARALKRGCDTSVELGDYIREKRLEDSLTEPSEDDVFPKGIDDSIGG